MKSPEISTLDLILKQEKTNFGGAIPRRDAVAWRGYLMVLAGECDSSILPSIRALQKHIPIDGVNPVSEILCGTNIQDEPANNGEKIEFVDESIFEDHSRAIQADTEHFGGSLPQDWAIAWAAILYGEHEWELLSQIEYQQLRALLPPIDNDPIERIQALLSRCNGGS